jgi:hypothetical protein
MELSEMEQVRRTDATKALLAEMRAGSPGAWWDHSYDELAGRTPTEALAAGDDEAVLQLIDEWYRRSEESAERHRSDPEFMDRIERKSAELRAARRLAS